VNSGFTRQIFEDNFPIISAKKENEQLGWFYNTHYPRILYPPINLKTFEKTKNYKETISQLLGKQISPKTNILTSLNRYERKKNIPLAIGAFSSYIK